MGGKGKKPVSVAPYQPTPSNEGYLLWDVELIEPDPKQPRKYFDPVKMAELKESIETEGILTPLKIIPLDMAGHAKLIDGERRLRAAKELGLKQVPVNLSRNKATDLRALFKESVIQNFCREDMTEIETARSLDKLMKWYGLNQAGVAKLVGKTPGWVSQMMKYLKLHPVVADKLLKREISPAMALAVTRVAEKDQPQISARLTAAKDDKGRALTTSEINMVVAKEATEKEVKVLKPKKGKQPVLNPDAMLVKLIQRQLAHVRPDVSALLEISEARLKKVEGQTLIDLERDVSALQQDFVKILECLASII